MSVVKLEVDDADGREVTTDSIENALDGLAAGTLTASDTRETLRSGLKSEDVEVRRAALGLAEEAGKAAPSLLAEILPLLVPCLSDDSAGLVKRGLATATALFTPTLLLLLNLDSDEAADESATTLQHLREVSQAALGALQTTKTDAVRTAALKFCEMRILAFTRQVSSKGREQPAVAGEWSLAALAAAGEHPLLRLPELEAQGEQTLTLLLNTMLHPPSNTSLLILLTTCTSLGKQRPQLASTLSSTLCELQRRLVARSSALAALQQAQLANAQQALRSTLITMLKLEALRETEHARAEGELADALRALGATEQLKQIYKQLGTEPPSEGGVGRAQWKESQPGDGDDEPDGRGGMGGPTGAAEEGQPSKRARTESSGGPALPPVGHPELEAILVRLGPHLVAELVIAAMSELPRRPPPRPPSGAPPADGADGADAGGGGRSAMVPLAPGELRIPGYTAPQCVALAESRLFELLSVGSEEALEGQGHAAARAQLIGRIAAQQPERSSFHQVVLGHIQQKCKERLPIVLSWLYEELAADPHAGTMDAGSGGGSSGGGSTAERGHEASAGGTAAAAAGGSAAASALPLAVPPSQSAGPRSGRYGRYERVLRLVLPVVREALPPNDRSYSQLLLDVPYLPDAVLLECLQADIQTPERRKLGLATARDLALRRDGAAPAALGFILQLSADAAAGAALTVKSEDGEQPAAAGADPALAGGGGEGPSAAEAAAVELRDDVIRVLASGLAAAAHLSTRILEFASTHFERALSEGGGGGEEGEAAREGGPGSAGGSDATAAACGGLGEAASAEASSAAVARCEAHMRLHLALCVHKPDLLWAWLHGYPRASAVAQRAMCELTAGAVAHVPAEALTSIVLEALGGGQVGGMAPLLLAILEAIAASGTPPPPQLVQGVALISLEQLRTGQFALPLVPYLDSVQCESLLPLLLALPGESQERALVAIMHADPQPIPPPRLLLLVHLLPTGAASSAGLELKHLKPAVETCMAERSVFTMQTMATCLKLIASQEPLPLISMRTTIQALSYWPGLTPFVMDLLRHLIGRRIWESPRLYTGFVKCCGVSLPDSLPVLLTLPTKALSDALEQEPEMRQPLMSYAAVHLSEVPQEAKEALGITEDEAEEL